MNVKPAMGFTLPSAGVTPAPSDRKSRNVEDAIPLSGFWAEASESYLARYFTERRPDATRSVGEGSGFKLHAPASSPLAIVPLPSRVEVTLNNSVPLPAREGIRG